MDYTIRKNEGWYAVIHRGVNRYYRGPFWWEWLAVIACWVP